MSGRKCPNLGLELFRVLHWAGVRCVVHHGCFRRGEEGTDSGDGVAVRRKPAAAIAEHHFYREAVRLDVTPCVETEGSFEQLGGSPWRHARRGRAVRMYQGPVLQEGLKVVVPPIAKAVARSI